LLEWSGRKVIFDEMLGDHDRPRSPYRDYFDWFEAEDPGRLNRKSKEAETFFRRTGITFNVYGQEEAAERLIPFDIVPRDHFRARMGAPVARHRAARARHQRLSVRYLSPPGDPARRPYPGRSDRVQNEAFLPKMIGVAPPGNIYTHIVGTDIVRTGEDEFFVLEDNARTPSGVSYMLENRETMLQMFPELFSKVRVQPVSDYPKNLRRSLSACAPPACDGKPVVAVLTPGIHNSAYFEHAFLADQMGAELVEGHDLRVVDGRIAMRTTRGYTPIDVIYRRIDDDFLDPLNFNPQSCWACRASWTSTAPAASPSPMRRAPASPTTRRSIPTCPTSSSSTPARRRS
jgi:uncharacterized circularly permuted ATP-grasp superfamily protein